MKSSALVVLCIAAPAAAEPDLALHRLPSPLHMRAVPTVTAALAASTVAPAASSVTSTVDSSFHPVPTSLRGLHERVTFKINGGYELDSAPASGEALRGGSQLPPGFGNTRSWITGDAVVGAHDLLLPSLGGYFLAGFQLDASDAIAERTAFVVPGDADDQRVAIKVGYAEYQTDDVDGHHVWLRGGRQYRTDGGAMFAYFDGATIGYRNGGVTASAFVGERAALYVDTPRGETFGATAALDLKRMRGWPVRVALDYMGLAIGAETRQFRELLAATGTIDVNAKARLELRARVVDAGEGLSFGRVDARLRYTVSRELAATAEVSERGSGDLAYDLAAPTAVDVAEVSRRLGVGLVAPTTSTSLGGHVDWRHSNRELLAFGRANIAEGAVTSVDQESWAEAGVAVAGAPVAKVWATLQYTLRDYFLHASANQAGTAFGNTAGSGLGSMHELALDGWWHGTSVVAQRWRVGGGLFYRIYDFATPYVAVSYEGRGGGRVDLRYLMANGFHVMAGAEVAQSSNTLMREIGTLTSVRLAMEARW